MTDTTKTLAIARVLAAYPDAPIDEISAILDDMLSDPDDAPHAAQHALEYAAVCDEGRALARRLGLSGASN